MAKIQISEEKLTSLIEESFIELLQEAEYDEGLGHWLGNKFQTLKNKFSNFKNDFKAGRNQARYNNRDYDSYSQYGNEADRMRNFDGPNYGRYRYQTTVDRNNRADNSWTTQSGTRVDSRFNTNNNNQNTNSEPTPNPDMSQQQEPQQQQQPQEPQEPQQQQQQPQQQIDAQQKMQDLANFLQQKGHELINGRWVYVKDNSNWPASKSRYDDIRKAALEYYRLKRNPNGMGLSESKKKINSIISESVNKEIAKFIKSNKKSKK